jgi:hypothetical protein
VTTLPPRTDRADESIDLARRAKPNLFIVGAAKSGTTALATFLGEHPDVFMAPWELNFFGRDLDFRNASGSSWRIPLSNYLGAFAYHHAERYRGDHSVFYLFSDEAAAEIRDFDPHSRILIMLRNPVDQMESQHSEMLFQGEEDIVGFAEALDAEPDRQVGKRIPTGCTKPFALRYRALARYADQVERYLSVFGREHVCVVLHDDLVREGASCYRTVLDFLGLEAPHDPKLRVVNANKTARFPKLRDLLRDTTPGKRENLRRLGRFVVRNGQARAQLRRRLSDMNTRRAPRTPMDPALRRRLQEEMADDIRRLELLLERDLSAWSEPVSSSTP